MSRRLDIREEFRVLARALEHYLRDKAMKGPMLGTQRRIEGRIGQLLPPHQGKRTDLELRPHADEVVKRNEDRTDFRIIARAVTGECEMTDGDWWKSRRKLVADIRGRLGLIPPLKPLPHGRFRCLVADPPLASEVDHPPEDTNL